MNIDLLVAFSINHNHWRSFIYFWKGIEYLLLMMYATYAKSWFTSRKDVTNLPPHESMRGPHNLWGPAP